MHRIEMNVATGEQKRIELSPSEITEKVARQAVLDAEKAAKTEKPSVEERIAALEAKLK